MPFDPITGQALPSGPIQGQPPIPNQAPPAAAPVVPVPASPIPPQAATVPPQAAAEPYAELTYMGERVQVPDEERGRNLMQVGYDVERQQQALTAREQGLEGREQDLRVVEQFRSFANRNPEQAAFVDDLMAGRAQLPTAQPASADGLLADPLAAPDPEVRLLRSQVQQLTDSVGAMHSANQQSDLSRDVDQALGEWPSLQDPDANKLGRDLLLAAKAANPRASVRALAGTVATRVAKLRGGVVNQQFQEAQLRQEAATIPPSVGTPGLVGAPNAELEAEVRTRAGQRAGSTKTYLKDLARKAGITGADWRPGYTPPAL